MDNTELIGNILGNLMVILLLFILAIIIAFYLGKKRQTGFKWSLFFSFFLNPLFGLIITILSRKIDANHPKSSKAKRIIGWIIMVWFGLAFFGASIPEYADMQYHVIRVFMTIGLIGLGYYLKELGRGKVFNKKAILTRNTE
jgi:hypothetical protein